MTPVFCCGFECGHINGSQGPHWVVNSGDGTSFSTTTVRSGARSLRCNAAGSAMDVRTTALASSTRRVGRAYVYFATIGSGLIDLITYSTSGGPRVQLDTGESRIYAYTGSAWGATGVSVSTGQWYRIDFDFNGSNGGNTTCDVQVNGTACGQASSAGTTAASTTLVLGVSGSVTMDVFFDDLVLSDTGADYPIGPGKVEHFVPTADGTHNVAGANDFERTLTGTDILNATTDAYLLVDDVPLESTVTDWINMLAPPNATDYVECVFGPAPGISTPTTAPRAVEVICGINQAGTGNGNMEIRLNDNGTTDVVYTATGVAGVAVATGQVFKRKHYAAGPAGAWTIGGGGNGDFTDLRIRFGSPAALDVNPDQYFGSAMIEAEFPDSAQTLGLSTIASGLQMFGASLALSLALPTLASSAALTTPAVGTQAITAPTIASTVALTAPTVAPGAVTLEAPTIAAGSALTAPTLAYQVQPPTIASGAALNAPSVAHQVQLQTIAAGSSLTAPTVAPGAVTLALPTLASGSQLFPPNLAASQTVALPTVASSSSLSAPTVAPGDVTLTLPTIASTAALTAPTLGQTLALPTIASSATMTAPSVALTVSLPTIASTAQLFAMTVAGSEAVVLPTIASTVALTAPTVAPGAVTVSLPTIGSTAALNAPTVAAGTATLTLPTIASTAVLTAPTLTAGAVSLTLPTIGSTVTLNPPTVVLSVDVDIFLPTLASGSQVFAPHIFIGPSTIPIDGAFTEAVSMTGASTSAVSIAAAYELTVSATGAIE